MPDLIIKHCEQNIQSIECPDILQVKFSRDISIKPKYTMTLEFSNMKGQYTMLDLLIWVLKKLSDNITLNVNGLFNDCFKTGDDNHLVPFPTDLNDDRINSYINTNNVHILNVTELGYTLHTPNPNSTLEKAKKTNRTIELSFYQENDNVKISLNSYPTFTKSDFPVHKYESQDVYKFVEGHGYNRGYHKKVGTKKVRVDETAEFYAVDKIKVNKEIITVQTTIDNIKQKLQKLGKTVYGKIEYDDKNEGTFQSFS